MGRTTRLAVALMVAGFGASATPAAAQQYLHYNVCGVAEGTALKACASADLTLDGTTLRMRVWNMEVDGASGMSSYGTEFGGWHVIRSVGLEYMGEGASGSGDLSSAVYVFGRGAENRRELTHWHSVQEYGANPLRVEVGSIADGHYEGIAGCTDPNPGRYDHVATCGSYGYMPFVQFTFTNVDPNIDFAQYNFEFFGVNMAGGAWAKGSGAGVPMPQGEVVPEPITMVLLGSGLLGVGGVNLRRRRKGQLNEVDPVA